MENLRRPSGVSSLIGSFTPLLPLPVWPAEADMITLQAAHSRNLSLPDIFLHRDGR